MIIQIFINLMQDWNIWNVQHWLFGVAKIKYRYMHLRYIWSINNCFLVVCRWRCLLFFQFNTEFEIDLSWRLWSSNPDGQT
jgi:hypothetical protein